MSWEKKLTRNDEDCRSSASPRGELVACYFLLHVGIWEVRFKAFSPVRLNPGSFFSEGKTTVCRKQFINDEALKL